ncbi:MAG: response regulator [Promethearchaeota archaeon]|nr:MAG: response regulator [Candidatus Lokiarchaeota archaeon]
MDNEKKFIPIEILLVEDNLADIRLTEKALEESKIAINLNIVNDGVEAINFLKRKDKYKGAIKPDLILLDLNLPKKSGLEVLEEIKNEPDLKQIPVVILTISENRQDLMNAYSLYANCYINKPLDLQEFYKVVKSIENFWFTIVKLPIKEEN